MTEIYIFNRDDDLLTILSESNGLISAPFRDELNNTPDTPLEITVDAQVEYQQSYAEGSYGRQLTQVASMFIGAYGTSDSSEKVNVSPAQFVKEGNSVVFKDREGKLREYVIKEIDDIDNIDGTETTATCLPAFVDELNDNYVLDKRYSDQAPTRAIKDITDGTRYTGEIDGTFGDASTNFYRITSLEALYQMRDVWGGDVTDEVILDDNGRISARKVILKQRLGADKGLRLEIDHNIEEIQRTILSYPKTAMYGYGASIETEGGGNTKYIDFGDVVWEKSSGDPADKPAGQTWVGDEDALQDSGISENGHLLHRYGKFSNQDYEEADELLHTTWQSLQELKKPEVNYKLSVDLFNKRAVMGDTAIAIDREFARPIEIQTRIIAIEYDLVDIDGTTEVELGQFLNLRDDRLDKIEDEIDDNRGKWENPQIDNGSFPDIKPDRPTNVVATGAFQTIQIKWDYADDIYIASYEVYGSQVADFSPAEQHLLYRGKVSAFGHEVDTDQTWYYYIRAVNTHGTVSEFSERAKASTVRLITDDILFGSITADLLEDNLELANKLTEGTVEWINGNRNLFYSDSLSTEGGTWAHTTAIGMPDGEDYISVKTHGVIPTSPILFVMVYFLSNKEDAISEALSQHQFQSNIEDTVIKHPLSNYVVLAYRKTSLSNSDFKKAKVKVEFGTTHTRYTTPMEDSEFVRNPVAFINKSEESIHINADKIAITGQTFIEEGVIGTASIAELAVNKFHLKEGIIDDAHIDKLTGNKFIAHSIDVDKLDVDELSAITANLGTVVGGKITQESSGDTTVMQSGKISMYRNNVLQSEISGGGHKFHYDDYEVGIIGTSGLDGRPDLRGLLFNLAHDAEHMIWAHKTSPSDSNPTIQLAWYKTDSYTGTKGFDFRDDVTVNSTNKLYVRTLSTTNYTDGDRTLDLENHTWDGSDGVILRRKGGAGLFLRGSIAVLRGKGNSYLEVGNDGENYIRSLDVYNREYTSTSQLMRITGKGNFGRSTSSRRYKLYEKDIKLDYAKRILQLDSKSWYDKRQAETHASFLTKLNQGIDVREDDKAEEDITRIGGVIAEDTHDAGLGMFVSYDDENRPNGISQNMWTLLIPIIKNQQERIERLENLIQ